MKINQKTIGLLFFATLILLASCQKEDQREGFLSKPKPQTAKGFMDCLINGNLWPRYGNSGNRVTVVNFMKGVDIIVGQYDKCDDFSKIRQINFTTFYPSGNTDLSLSFFMKAETGTFNKIFSYSEVDFYTPGTSTIFCQKLPIFAAGGIMEIDAPLARYYLDNDFANTLTISAISDSIIEGSFHIKLLDSNYAVGLNNPNGVPDSLEFDCKKFKAVLGKVQ